MAKKITNIEDFKGPLPHSKVRDLVIKCYDEQMPKGWSYVKKCIRRQNKANMHVSGICHDEDETYEEGSIWLAAVKKRHFHIVVKLIKRGKDGRIIQQEVMTILNKLGIYFRPGEDDKLWIERGIERIDDYVRSITYLPHWTEDARRESKHEYEMKDIVSNLDEAELRQIMDGYINPSEANRKVSNAHMEDLKKIAEQKGYALESLEDWLQTLSIAELSSSKLKPVKDAYWYQAQRRIEESKDMLRLCVYIQGEHNVGKSYNSFRALQKLGYKVFTVDSGDSNTGKFDALKAEHTAMLVDDATIKDVLSMSDNRICTVYRRNRNNPFWAGEILIVTNNKSFEEWAKQCGVSDEQMEAARSRFYLCHIKNKYDRAILICDEPSTRGTRKNQEARRELFEKFQDLMDEGMAEYMKMKQENTMGNIYKGLNISRTKAPKFIKAKFLKATQVAESKTKEQMQNEARNKFIRCCPNIITALVLQKGEAFAPDVMMAFYEKNAEYDGLLEYAEIIKIVDLCKRDIDKYRTQETNVASASIPDLDNEEMVFD